jgi:hypothetical protein
MGEPTRFTSLQATHLAAAVLRSFVVDNGRPRCQILTWTNNQFRDWKQNGAMTTVEDLLGHDLTKSGASIKYIGEQYLTRVSEHWQTGRALNTLCVDANNIFNWPGLGQNFMQTLYHGVNLDWAAPANERDFPEMLKRMAASWKVGATYLIDKYRSGRALMEAHD